jgi:hypothetical protein
MESIVCVKLSSRNVVFSFEVADVDAIGNEGKSVKGSSDVYIW